ncbi:DMT family transporter [Candidatus Saccharibacteria bacterium]|nr:DMT family transporter [Candidatus Saccharibacteria bacterium]
MYTWVGYSVILIVMTPFMLGQISELFDLITTLPLIVLGAAIAYIIATQFNLEALKREDLSYTAPLNAFVPVFTFVIAIRFLNESPTKMGVLGIVIVVIGAYIVSLKPERTRWYDPLTRLFTSPGALFSIGVSFFLCDQ